MEFQQWSKFSFFNHEAVENPLDGVDVIDIIVAGSYIFVAHRSGSISVLTRHFEVTTFPAFETSCNALFDIDKQLFFAAIGHDTKPVVKIWHYQMLEVGVNPTCTRKIMLSGSLNSIVASSSLKYMIFGYNSGLIQLFENDIAYGKRSNTTEIGQKNSPITNTFLLQKGTSNELLLYATTSKELFIMNVMKKEKELQSLPDCGAATNCIVFNKNTIFIARDRTLKQLTINSEGLISAPATSIMTTSLGYSPLLLRSYADQLMITYNSSRNSDIATQHSIRIYELRGQCEAFLHDYPKQRISFVLIAWNSVFLWLNNNELFRLTEMPLQQKLHEMCKSDQYKTALDLVRDRDDVPKTQVKTIHKKYADFLYRSIKDYSAAIEQYIATIGHEDPSNVIRLYLDGPKIQFLIEYLEALHRQPGQATSNHSTLLINCYARLKKISQLDTFVSTINDADGDGRLRVEFDIDAAIRVLRNSGNYSYAAKLAKDHGQIGVLVRLLMENLGDFRNGLVQMRKLQWDEILPLLKRFTSELQVEIVELMQLLSHHIETSTSGVVEECVSLLPGNESRALELLMPLLAQPPAPNDTLHWLVVKTSITVLQFCSDMERAQVESKICPLLTDLEKRHLHKAIILCQNCHFKAGLKLLCSRSKDTSLLLSEDWDCEMMLKLCSDSEFSIIALQHIVANEPDAVAHALKLIPDSIPAMKVIDILCGSSTINLGACREYLLNHLVADTEAVRDATRQQEKLLREIDQLDERLLSVESGVVEFHNTKCSFPPCGMELKAPSIHFLCQHSYHQHCFQSQSRGNNNSCYQCDAIYAKNNESQSAAAASNATGGSTDVNLSDFDDSVSFLAALMNAGTFEQL